MVDSIPRQLCLYYVLLSLGFYKKKEEKEMNFLINIIYIYIFIVTTKVTRLQLIDSVNVGSNSSTSGERSTCTQKIENHLHTQGKYYQNLNR